MEGKTFIGIDPGSKGFCTVIYPDNSKEFISISDNDELGLARELRRVKDRSNGNIVACMEEIHAIFGSSAKATFSFGQIFGILKGILVALETPYHLVPPKTWQKEIWINSDMVVSYKTMMRKGKEIKVKDINTKATSFNASRRLFPDVDLRRSVRCKNLDDNKSDSLLIAEYARRKNL